MVPEGSAFAVSRHCVGHRGAHRDLDSFKGIDCQKAQLPIEHIDIEDVVEGGARSEGVGGSVGLEGNCVWGESIVSDVSEVSGGAIPVRDDESAFNVALNEFVLVECWFIVTLTWRIHPPMVRCWRVKTPRFGRALTSERPGGCCGASVHGCTRCEGCWVRDALTSGSRVRFCSFLGECV